MALVGQEQGLGQTVPYAIGLGKQVESGDKNGLNRQGAIGASLVTLVLGLALGVFEDLGFEEGVVGFGGLVKGLGALGVEFEGGLELFEGVLDLDVLGVVDLFDDVVLGLDIDGRESWLQSVEGQTWRWILFHFRGHNLPSCQNHPDEGMYRRCWCVCWGNKTSPGSLALGGFGFVPSRQSAGRRVAGTAWG